MILQKLAKTYFSQYLVYFSKQYFEVSKKTYQHGNNIINTTSPGFFWCKNVFEVLFSETSKTWNHLNQKIAQCNINSW